MTKHRQLHNPVSAAWPWHFFSLVALFSILVSLSAWSSPAFATTISVQPDPTATSVSCTSPVQVGQVTQCSATVRATQPANAPAPTGQVSFSTRGSSCTGQLTAQGTATATTQCTLTMNYSGTQTVTANYQGSSTDQPSSGTTTVTVKQGITPTTTTTTPTTTTTTSVTPTTTPTSTTPTSTTPTTTPPTSTTPTSTTPTSTTPTTTPPTTHVPRKHTTACPSGTTGTYPDCSKITTHCVGSSCNHTTTQCSSVGCNIIIKHTPSSHCVGANCKTITTHTHCLGTDCAFTKHSPILPGRLTISTSSSTCNSHLSTSAWFKLILEWLLVVILLIVSILGIRAWWKARAAIDRIEHE